MMERENVRDSAFESVDVEDNGNESADNTSLDLLEQQQAREQARLLQRFRELRQWQQQQQEQLMQQQHTQLEMLKGEQLRVQTLVASQRGAQWGEGRVSRPGGVGKSPPLMTPPRRTGAGTELAKAMMAQASTDSGLVASMGDTLDQQRKDWLPKPVMYPTSPSADDDKYTNPDLFSNPGSYDDDMVAVDDRLQYYENRSEVGSDNFYLPPLPPDPKESQADVGSQLKTLQALMGSTAPNFLQQMLGLLPPQQKALLLEQRQAAVQESASPNFSPVHPSSLHHSLPLAGVRPATSAAATQSLDIQSSGAARLHPPQNFSQAKGFDSQGQFHKPAQELSSQSAHFLLSSQSAGFPVNSQSAQFSLSSQSAHVPASSQAGYLAGGQGHRQISQSQNAGAPGLPQNYPSVPLDAQQIQYLEQRLQQQQLYLQQQQSQRLAQHQQRFASQQKQPPQSHAQSHQQSHPQSHTQQPQTSSKHVPFEPHVRLRGSWEEVRNDGDGIRKSKEFPSSQHREEEYEEEEEGEEEELEVTVKHAPDSPEERPIKAGLQGRMTFEQLLEEQLADEEQALALQEERRRQGAQEKSSAPTKRPFLRKGQGIARFSQPIKRPPPKRSSAGGGQRSESSRPTATSRSQSSVNAESERTAATSKPAAKRQPEKKRISGGKKKIEEEEPLQPEKLKLIKRRSETGKKSQPASKPQTSLQRNGEPTGYDDQDEKDSIADDASFVAGLKEREKKAPREAEELDEFEALEDIADNMSLVSNSSVVKRLITPNRQRQKNAVSDLKTVLEKKKNAPSSPFERNTAIRSLLSVNVPCPPVSRSQELNKQTQGPSSENDDTLVDDDTDVDLDLEAEGGRNAGDAGSREKERESGHTLFDDRTATEREFGAVKNVFPENGLRQCQTVSGFEFSKQFSLFDQHRHESDADEYVPPSPTKSVTRKVATLQSRLNAANDTAALLQKLTAQAGVLSSGYGQSDHGEKNVGENVYREENGGDNSLLSTSVSRPQPFVIGGKKGEESGNVFGSDGRKDERLSDDDDSDEATIEENDDKSSSSEEQGLDEGRDQQRHPDSSDNERGTARDQQRHPDSSDNDYGASNGDGNKNNNRFDFDDEDEWTSGGPQAFSSQSSGQQDSAGAGDSTPPTSKLMSRLFPKLNPKPTATQQQHQQKMQMASSTSVGDGIQSKVLREKLAELETEIEKFRTENAALDKLRRDREEGLNKLKEEIARFEQEKSDELRRLEEFKAQETKKLKHERKLFETYQKQVRSMPDKKDREEIETLKRQLTDLQDEMKRKESRWTSTQTRLKTRITELEGENAEMREEMKMMERKRLEWMQTRGAHKPTQPQTTTTTKATPRSSTPTSETRAINNGINSNHITSVANGGRIRPPPNHSGAVTMTTHMNGAGAAGTAGSRGGGHSGSGGESMPRDQPATPSMIEGVSPAAMADGGDGSASFMAEPSTARPALDRPTVDKGNGQYEETQYSDGKVERLYTNGSREVLFANGTRKEISSDGQYFIVSFFNGDIKQVFPDQHVVYYYAESQTTHTTYPDKLEVLQFPNNQIEKHYPDGTQEITFPNQTVKYLFPNGTEESIFPDGTILRIDKNGEKILEFPNGQREIHTQQHKRREYPDGTVKTLHNDGRQETRYSTGRIRLKDKDGNVLLDRMY
ncbi:centromere protein J-like isoform X2 [Littorina saxatilis]|uniref:centromere protein J-like isoform X2 n=1 Tax=Littorina saxatilis TaxID=31220 RepID=UPI0038B607F8